ncbi:MAG: DUF5682 family protein [Aestuariivirga sp.]
MSERLHLLGIRHHGPGSAASVIAALDAINPAIVLIEGPADANSIIEYAAKPGMRPPLAILVHDADDPSKAVFYPFAEFSPEWQAIHWALHRKRPVRFIDLAAGHRLGNVDELSENALPSLHRDPLSALAHAASESDGESWWNGVVEQSAGGPEVFAAIADAMTALRQSLEADAPMTAREIQREAHMRLEIGKALGETEKQIAVVCGAWHVPALREEVPPKKDRELLKGAAIAKTIATWVPWTDTRLAAISGYGAGVISPGWYRHLWTEFHVRGTGRAPMAVAARWQTRVASLLREEGLPSATASVIEAARLAISLAAVRGFPLPGLAEMQDASLSVMCHGDDILLRLIGQRLVIGDEIGEIDESVPQMPLAEDLQRWQKRLRMKPSASEEEMAVDLRSETGLLKSALLHRLLLIDVPWGQVTDAQAGRGTFREIWRIAWQPELSVKLAEAVRFGTTIEQSAGNAALEAAEKETGLARCAELIGRCLNADLPEAAEKLTSRLQALGVNSGDIAQLMSAAPPLINILRYGTARKLPREALLALVSGMSAEICAGLGPACQGLNEEATQAMFAAMQSFDGAVPLLEDAYHLEAWFEALSRIEADDSATPFLRGFALRRLYDGQKRDAETAATRLARALSPSMPTQEGGQWLEGFLSGAAQLLLHDAQLFGIIDRWLGSVAEESFVELLPVLRRAISSFDSMERRRLLEQVKRDTGGRADAAPVLDDDPRAAAAFATALPLLKTILGLTDEPTT